jgi:hypothetical protein
MPKPFCDCTTCTRDHCSVDCRYQWRLLKQRTAMAKLREERLRKKIRSKQYNSVYNSKPPWIMVNSKCPKCEKVHKVKVRAPETASDRHKYCENCKSYRDFDEGYGGVY